MQIQNWCRKIYFWVLHLIGWVLLNVLLGSFPFINTLLGNEKTDPFQIGLLCFCFTVVSSGLYTTLVDSQKDEQSGLAKAGYTVMISIAVFWILTVWTIVLKLQDILLLIDDEAIVKGGLLVLYTISIILYFLANFKSLYDLVNSHLSKKLIADPVSNSQASGSVMGASLKDEEDF